MLNVNTIFYISFVSLLFKMFKNGTLTEEQILMKKEKKITQLQNRKKKREDRIKTKIFRQNLRKDRKESNIDLNDDNDTDISNDSDNEIINEKKNGLKLKATSNTLTNKEKQQLIDTSLWD